MVPTECLAKQRITYEMDETELNQLFGGPENILGALVAYF